MSEADFDTTEYDTDLDLDLDFEPVYDIPEFVSSGELDDIPEYQIQDIHDLNKLQDTEPVEPQTETYDNYTNEGTYNAETGKITVEGTDLQGENADFILSQFQQGAEGLIHTVSTEAGDVIYESNYFIEGNTLRIDTVAINKEDKILGAEYLYDDDDGDVNEADQNTNIFGGAIAVEVPAVANLETVAADGQATEASQKEPSLWANMWGSNNKESLAPVVAESIALEKQEKPEQSLAPQRVLEPSNSVPESINFAELFWTEVSDSPVGEKIIVQEKAPVKEYAVSSILNFGGVFSVEAPVAKVAGQKGTVIHRELPAKDEKLALAHITEQKFEAKPEKALARPETSGIDHSEGVIEELPREAAQKAHKSESLKKEELKDAETPGEEITSTAQIRISVKKSPSNRAKSPIKLKSEPKKRVVEESPSSLKTSVEISDIPEIKPENRKVEKGEKVALIETTPISVLSESETGNIVESAEDKKIEANDDAKITDLKKSSVLNEGNLRETDKAVVENTPDSPIATLEENEVAVEANNEDEEIHETILEASITQKEIENPSATYDSQEEIKIVQKIDRVTGSENETAASNIEPVQIELADEEPVIELAKAKTEKTPLALKIAVAEGQEQIAEKEEAPSLETDKVEIIRNSSPVEEEVQKVSEVQINVTEKSSILHPVETAQIITEKPAEIKEITEKHVETKELSQNAKPVKLERKAVQPEKTTKHTETAHTKVEQMKQVAKKSIERRREVIKLVNRVHEKRQSILNAAMEKNKKVLEFKRREKPAEKYAFNRQITKVVRTGPRLENGIGGITLRHRNNYVTNEEKDRLIHDNKITPVPVYKARRRIPMQKTEIRIAA